MPTPPSRLTADQKNLWGTLHAYLKTDEAEAVRQAVEKTTTGWSGFFATLANPDAIQRFAAFVQFLRRSGYNVLRVDYLVMSLEVILRPANRTAARAFLASVAQSGSKVQQVLGVASKAGFVVGIITMLLNTFSHISRGTWGPAAAEIFKFVVGSKMPFLGIVDAVEQLVSAYVPGAAGHVAWSYIRALNVLGMAGVGVDTFATLVQQLVDMAVARQIDPAKFEAAMRGLDERIRSSPASVFSTIGDNLAAAFDQMSTMTPQAIASDLWTGFVYTLQGGR